MVVAKGGVAVRETMQPLTAAFTENRDEFAIHLLFMNLLASDSFIGQINNIMPNSRNECCYLCVAQSSVFPVTACLVSHRKLHACNKLFY